ncbi:hypothetical protein SAY86_003347 [Trapa natans]|uniref:CCT domain-containing protein n=1 Tax=Trapa natans TaxID=22666 RepID=A0AAN7MWI4_TRANT|nr:hypothetical protein SAY86_003347 [Trapa natans]
MAPISQQSYCYQATLPDHDEDEFCHLSAPYNNNIPQVPLLHSPGSRVNMSSMGLSNAGRGAMWAHHHQEPFTDNRLVHHQLTNRMLPFAPDASVHFSAYPEGLGISDLVVPDFISSSFCSFKGEPQLAGRETPLPPPAVHHDLCDLWGDSSDSEDHRLKPLYHALCDMNQGIQANKLMPLVDDSSTKVGRYTVEERKDRILKYLKKRNQRNFNKTIKYACRKTLADRRVRVRGRFARNNDSCDEETAALKKNETTPQQQNDLLFSDEVQIKQDNDDDQWLQEAMASLMYLPYISGMGGDR